MCCCSIYVYRHLCLNVCVRKTLVFLFPQTGRFDLGTGLQGRPLPSQIQSLSNTESQRGRVAERRRRELGRDRREREGERDKEGRQRIGKALGE